MQHAQSMPVATGYAQGQPVPVVQAPAAARPTLTLLPLAGGAVVGGVIAGPVGALIGAGVGAAVGASSRRRETVAVGCMPRSFSVQLPQDAISEHGGVTMFAMDVFPLDGRRPWRILKRYNDFSLLCANLDKVGPTTANLPQFPRKHLTGCSGSRLEDRRRMLEYWLQTALTRNYVTWDRHLRSFLGCDLQMNQSAGSQAQPVLASAVTQPSSQGVYTASLPRAQATPIPSSRVASQPVLATPPPSARPADPASRSQRLSAAGTSPFPGNPTSSLGHQTLPGPTSSLGHQASGLASTQTLSASAPTEVTIQAPQNIAAGQSIMVAMPDGKQLPLIVPQDTAAGSSLKMLYDASKGTLSAATEQGCGQSSSTSQPEPSGQILSVQVPAGIASGQLLGVTVPDGRQLTVPLPAGATAGSDLQLWFDPSASTLTPLS